MAGEEVCEMVEDEEDLGVTNNGPWREGDFTTYVVREIGRASCRERVSSPV